MQIVWFYYALPVVLGIDISAHVAATLVPSLYTGAFYAEIIRGGVTSIERGQSTPPAPSVCAGGRSCAAG